MLSKYDLLALLEHTAHTEAISIVGLTGGPAAGKSTLASWLANELNGRQQENIAIALSIDGFLMPSASLEQAGLLFRKGTIQTYEVDALLKSLIAIKLGGLDLTLPAYSRQTHDVVPNAIRLNGEKIIILEGNYLSTPLRTWMQVRELIDILVFIDTERHVCRDRLLTRHLLGGRSTAEAEKKIMEVDLPNFDQIIGWREACDYRVKADPD
jgi:pantothenate kinase